MIDDKIRNGKLQYDISRKAAKISALSSGKIDKYEYIVGEQMLPCNQSRIIEHGKLTYSPLGKLFKKQIKIIENQSGMQIKALREHKKRLIGSNALVTKN